MAARLDDLFLAAGSALCALALALDVAPPALLGNALADGGSTRLLEAGVASLAACLVARWRRTARARRATERLGELAGVDPRTCDERQLADALAVRFARLAAPRLGPLARPASSRSKLPGRVVETNPFERT